MPLERTPWDGTERRKEDAPTKVTSLKIATRAAEGSPLDADQMFTQHETPEENHVRPADFGNPELQNRVGNILSVATKDDEPEEAVASSDAEVPAVEPTPESNSQPKEKRELSLEEAERTLQSLLRRSKEEKYKNLCPTIDWARAERAIKETPEVLWTVHQAREHEPIIYYADETGFEIGSNLCIASPQATRNCVGHKQAEAWMKKHYPNEQFNSNAEKQAEDMGWGLMTIERAEHFIQNTPTYYEEGSRYYHTPDDIKAIGPPEGPGRALDGRRDGAVLAVYQYDAYDHGDAVRGWGGSLRVNYVD